MMGSRGKMEHGYDGGDGRVGLEVGVDELPARETHVKSFFMDTYEITNAEYKEFIDDTKRDAPVDTIAPDARYNWKDGVFPEGEARHPVVNIDWFEAYAYCKWAGKRLPTETEWEKTCRGKDSRKWSFGNYFVSQYANTRELNLGWSQRVGSFPEDRSPYGVYDMVGNVQEWVASWYKPYPGSTLKRETFGEENKVIKGGAFLTVAQTSRCTNRNFAVPEKTHRTMGFRCAKSAENRE